MKSLNYLDNLLARSDARVGGCEEAILLNTSGLVAEGSASNVFLVRDGRLLTPSLASGALAGITREAVIELAASAGIDVSETEIAPAAFADASEAFLTNSIMEIMPLTRLDGRAVGSGAPGPVTCRVRRLYHDLIVQETGSEPVRDRSADAC